MSGIGILKAAAACGIGARLNAAQVDELIELITEHDGVECTKHDVIVKSAVQRVKELEEVKNAYDELFKMSHRGIIEVVEEALGREMVSDAYTAVHRLANAYSELKKQIASERDEMAEWIYRAEQAEART